MITGQSFVYFGPEAWDGMWRNRHHLLSRLAQQNRVVYVEPRPYLEEVLAAPGRLRQGGGLLREGGLRRVNDGLWVYGSPRYAPLGGPPPVRAVTHALRRAHLRRTLAGVGVRQPLVWLSTPTQFDARDDLPARLRVYHIVDEYLAYHDLPAERRASFAQREQALIRWADRVLVVSEALLETKGRGAAKFRLLPNAVDERAYAGPRAEQPQALAALRRPILGYVGLVSVRLDLALLDALTVQHPEWSLVLMGDVNPNGCAELLDRLAARPNVHFLPARPGNEVGSYVRWFDIGLAPYRVTSETIHASPLKIYEYLAAGLPVVAAGVPGASQFGAAVALADTVEGWAATIARELAQNSAAAAGMRQQAVAAHTWSARVETLSGILAEALAER